MYICINLYVYVYHSFCIHSSIDEVSIFEKKNNFTANGQLKKILCSDTIPYTGLVKGVRMDEHMNWELRSFPANFHIFRSNLISPLFSFFDDFTST